MHEIDAGVLPNDSEPEPYLVFEHDDSPWWMWPFLATIIITRDQWIIRMTIVIICMLLLLVLLGFAIGLMGFLIVLVFAIIAAIFGYYSYRYGRAKAVEYSNRRRRLR